MPAAYFFLYEYDIRRDRFNMMDKSQPRVCTQIMPFTGRNLSSDTCRIQFKKNNVFDMALHELFVKFRLTAELYTLRVLLKF